MRPPPSLIPEPPTPGNAVALSTSPFWIGSAPGCPLRLYLPGIAGRHAAVLEREDGFWIAPGPGASPVAMVNGSVLDGERLLSHGDVIELAPAVRYRFDSGEPPIETVEEEPAEPVFAEAPAPRRRRRRRGLTAAQKRRIRFALLAGIAIAIVLGLIAAATVMLLRTL